jgi:hypothetical protein
MIDSIATQPGKQAWLMLYSIIIKRKLTTGKLKTGKQHSCNFQQP